MGRHLTMRLTCPNRPALFSTFTSTFACVLFLSCARPALCAPAEPVYTESYPAIAWQEVGKEEADSLNLLWYGEPQPVFSTIEEWANMPSKWTQRMYWVHRATHPLLDSLLPGTTFYSIADKCLFSTGGPEHYTLALRDGKFYRLDRLNYLLRDAGFKFDTTEMADITKAAVLWTLLEKYPRNDSISAATAFPAVGFGEVECGWWDHPPVLVHQTDGGTCYAPMRVPGAWVADEVAGIRERTFVQFRWFSGGTFQADIVAEQPGGMPSASFGIIWPPPSPAPDPEPR